MTRMTAGNDQALTDLCFQAWVKHREETPFYAKILIVVIFLKFLLIQFSASIHRGATEQTGSGARGSLELSRVQRSWRTGVTQYEL